MVELMNQKELAKLLGTSVAVLNTLRCRGTLGLPYYKIGRKVMYNPKDVEKWLNGKGKTCKRRSFKLF